MTIKEKQKKVTQRQKQAEAYLDKWARDNGRVAK